MLYGALFLVMSAALVVHATSGGLRLLYLWPALTCALVGLCYLRLGPGLLGKRADGGRAFASTVVFFPYIAAAHCVWTLLRLFRRERAFDRVHDGLYLGRRLLDRELPDEVDQVLDLTTEMLDPRALRDRGYHAHPTLDGISPPDEELYSLAHRYAARDGVTYVHCAEGHGRAATVAAAILLAEGRASTVDEAVALLKAVRPAIGPRPPQRAALERLARKLDDERAPAE